jgi:hypothetical protein
VKFESNKQNKKILKQNKQNKMNNKLRINEKKILLLKLESKITIAKLDYKAE